MEVWPYLRKRELQRLYNTNYNTGMAFRPGCPPNQDTQAFSAPSSTGATSYRAATLGTCAVLSGFKKKKKKGSGPGIGGGFHAVRKPSRGQGLRGPATRAPQLASQCPGGSSSSQAASGTTGTCTRRTGPPPRRASAASTGWMCGAAQPLPPSRVSVRPGRERGRGRGRPQSAGPRTPSLPSQAPATTATAATRTWTRVGPGATSAARRARPRSGLARTCAAQVATRAPAPRAVGEQPPLRRARASA